MSCDRPNKTCYTLLVCDLASRCLYHAIRENERRYDREWREAAAKKETGK